MTVLVIGADMVTFLVRVFVKVTDILLVIIITEVLVFVLPIVTVTCTVLFAVVELWNGIR